MTEATTPDDASEVTSGRLLRNTVVNGVAYVSSALITAGVVLCLFGKPDEAPDP